MNFGENLQYLRDHAGLTQEALAEQLEVSRQSVSKWESGGSFPEMEKLLALCEMFGVTMDTLLRGDAAVAVSEDDAGYDAHSNWYTRMIAGGAFLVLLGVSLMMLVLSVGVSETMATALLLTMIAIAVVLFIVAGMTHGAFEKKHPMIQDFYAEEEKDKTHRKSMFCIAGGVAMILIGLVWLVLFGDALEATELLEHRMLGTFMLVLACAVATLIYGGMQGDKCDLEKWNREHDQSLEQKALRGRVGAICGCIMLLATAIFLAIGLGDMALGVGYGARSGWRWAWIVFPVAGVLCGVVSTFMKRNDPD